MPDPKTPAKPETKSEQPQRRALVKFPKPGFVIRTGERRESLEGVWDPVAMVTTCTLSNGDELKVSVHQALTLVRATPGPAVEE